jgi:uncharacterized OsmC-like protein
MNKDELRKLQTPLKQKYKENPDSATVGFKNIRLFYDLETNASDEQIDTLLKLTERYCIVFQTLQTPLSIEVNRTKKPV